MTTPPPAPRHYEVRASSAPTFGRVLCSARNHHFVVDGPVQNGCPGEALTPPELFLSAVAACGVELLHVIARDGLTDGRFFALYQDTPVACFGPEAQNIHGIDESVGLDSVHAITRTIALTMAEWCGVEPVQEARA